VDYPHRNIRFTTTNDGVDIAFWEIGEGKPVVILNLFSNSHAELEWTVPSLASFYMEMAETYRVIRFDPRGSGLSGEPPGGWGASTPSGAQQGLSSVELGLDISAVAAALELDSFVLLASSVQTPVAIEYAATHPGVSELILCDAVAGVAKSWLGPLMRAEVAFNQVETEAGPVFTIWERIGPLGEVDRLVGLARAALGRGRREAMTEWAQLEWDAESSLGDVSVPTPILTTRDAPFETLTDARHVASGIDGSRLVSLEGDERSPSPYWTERTQTLETIDDFLQPENQTRTRRIAPSAFRTVVFTDIVESTEFVRRVGDEAGRATVRDIEQRVEALAADQGGRVVKNLGDGSLVSFGSNSSAIRFALAVQEECSDGPLDLRVGMAAGEPIQEDGDIHGTVVAHASRIGDLGEAGEVIVSDSVRQLSAGKGFTFEPKGEVTLKGFDEPERVWSVIRP
jgi:class 3 adenylate cyclase